MKLFLSSENLGKYPDVFVEMCGSSKSVLYVGNAGDYKSEAEHDAKIAEHKAQFEGLGLNFTQLDLRDYFDKPLPETVLNGHGMVWCAGGNTFLLRAAFKCSGFDKVLTNAVKAGAIAYGGSSAGAILAGPTLHGTQHGDDPKAVHDVYNQDIVWDGLNFVDVVCIPHYESDWFGEEAKKMEQALKDTKQEYVILRDGQVLLVDDEKTELLA